MKAINQLSLHPDDPGTGQPGLTLATGNQSVQLKNRGSVLDAQFVTSDNRYVVFTSDDTPSEAGLYISLLSSELNDIEHITLQQEYADGVLTNVAAKENDQIQFEFFKGITHTLHSFPTPRFMFRSGSEVTYSRSFFSRKHIIVTR